MLSGGRDANLSVRGILDYLRIPERLEAVQCGVWQGGTISFVSEAQESDTRLPPVGYELRATWDIARLEPVSTGWSEKPVPVGAAALDGQWRRVGGGYVLRAGIDPPRRPGVLTIASPTFTYVVPFNGHPDADVERALNQGFALYGTHFFKQCQPVPVARAAAADLLRRRGI